MKVGLYAAVAGFLLGIGLIIGCGGGGGGGGGTGGPGGGGSGLGTDAPLPGQYIEFVNGSGDIVDPLGLRPGSVIELEAVSYDPAGNRTVLATGAWTAVGGSNYTLSSDGTLTINGVTGFFQVRVTATVAGSGKDLAQDARASNDTSVVTGQVVDAFTLTGIKYIQVEFYAGGTRVAAVLTGDDGNFSAVVPSTVTGVSAKGLTIPSSTYYRQLRYNGSDYTVDGSTCAISFTITNPGGNNAMPTSIRLIPISSGPPPPPGGCL